MGGGQTGTNHQEVNLRGTWVAQSAERLTLGWLGSLSWGCGIKLRIGLCTQQGV